MLRLVGVSVTDDDERFFDSIGMAGSVASMTIRANSRESRRISFVSRAKMQRY
jgi:hypothetical protein